MKITFEVQDDKTEIPQGQRVIIKQAITFYLSSLENIGISLDEEANYTHFDLLQLKGMLDYPLYIQISDEDKIKFTSKYGIDFPQYI